MNFPAKKLDRVAMVRATESAADHVRHILAKAEAVEHDIDKGARIEAGMCPACHYLLNRAGGASITHQPCAMCGADQSYASTATDVLCLACAREHSLCKRCGGDREMRPRRRNWPTPAASRGPA